MQKLPVDIVLCRHGESEGNLAQRHSRKGNQSFWSSDFSKRHTSSYRLTSRGREHAKIAGDWIKKVCQIILLFFNYVCLFLNHMFVCFFFTFNFRTFHKNLIDTIQVNM